ncbi:MAG: lipid-A-disaccharide synthase [Candidatus Schekmanbacteria bacterium]|nr:lipid-A-disaccharide synthase [Candidatus Schekmanbacteria bacterium]
MGSEPLRIFACAGDVSGDLHLANLVRELQRLATGLPGGLMITGLGGALSVQAGMQRVADTSAVSAVGLAEVLGQVAPALRLIRRAKQHLLAYRPDVAVLLDYPGINVPLSLFLRQQLRVPTVWYLPPDEWRWSTRGTAFLDRSRSIVRGTTCVLASHPREAAHYAALGCAVELVGHPLQDAIAQGALPRPEVRRRLGFAAHEKVVALVPASRRQEMRLVWPAILDAAAILQAQRPDVRFALPVASRRLLPLVTRGIARWARRHGLAADTIRVAGDGSDPGGVSAAVFAAADMAIAKTGTANLGLALHDVPQVAVYRLGRLTELLGKHLLRMTREDCRNVALVNHIMDEEIIPEFTQAGRSPIARDGVSPAAIAAAAAALLDDESAARRRVLAGYARLRERLLGPGASARAAAAIVRVATDSKAVAMLSASVPLVGAAAEEAAR